MIRVTVERGSENVCVEIDGEEAFIGKLMDGGVLQAAQFVNTLVNGKVAAETTRLSDGDTVTQTPKSGDQG